MPLRNVIVLAPSGLVLFAKEYGKAAAQPRLLGSLLTAMAEFATQTTAMLPSYIEMSSMAVTMVRDDVAKVSCALVHDRTDTASFGRLIAEELLLAFVEEYSGDGARLESGAQDLKAFRGFESEIPGVVHRSAGSVLARVSASRHILHAALISEDANGALHINQSGGAEIDQLSLLAASKYLFFATDLVLEYRRDKTRHTAFDDDGDETRTLLWRVQNCVLMICVIKAGNRATDAYSYARCGQAKSLIDQILKQSIALRRPSAYR